MSEILNPHMWDLWDTPEESGGGFWQGYEEWLDQLEQQPPEETPRDQVEDHLPF